MEFLSSKSVKCVVPILLFMTAILLQYSLALILSVPIFKISFGFIVVQMEILRLSCCLICCISIFLCAVCGSRNAFLNMKIFYLLILSKDLSRVCYSFVIFYSFTG